MAAAMTLLRKSAVLPPLVAILLTGCASSGRFPSLARRAQEGDPARITGTVAVPAASEPSGPVAPSADPTGPEADPAVLRREASAARDSFLAHQPRADQLTRAAQGAATGSEAWSQAAVALAELTAAHDATLAALAGLDSLYVRERVDGGDGGAIAAVRDQVTAWVAEEDAVLAGLEGRMPR